MTAGAQERARSSTGSVSCFGGPYRFLITVVRKIFMYAWIFIELLFASILMSWHAAWKSKYFKGAKGFFFFFPPALPRLLFTLWTRSSSPTRRRPTAASLSTKTQQCCLRPLEWDARTDPPPTTHQPPFLKGTEPAANQCPTNNTKTPQGWRGKKNKTQKRKKTAH